DHQQDEIRPQARHNVIRVKQKREWRWPLITRELIKSFDFGFSCAVDQKTQDVVDDERIVNFLGLFIGLPHQHNSCAALSVEQPFHSGNCRGLLLRHITAMKIASRENLRNTRNYSGNHADAHKNSSVFSKAIL